MGKYYYCDICEEDSESKESSLEVVLRAKNSSKNIFTEYLGEVCTRCKQELIAALNIVTKSKSLITNIFSADNPQYQLKISQKDKYDSNVILFTEEASIKDVEACIKAFKTHDLEDFLEKFEEKSEDTIVNDREFILALKAWCEQNVKRFDRITTLDNDLVGMPVTNQSTAYLAVVKMIEVYLDKQTEERVKHTNKNKI